MNKRFLLSGIATYYPKYIKYINSQVNKLPHSILKKFVGGNVYGTDSSPC